MMKCAFLCLLVALVADARVMHQGPRGVSHHKRSLVFAPESGDEAELLVELDALMASDGGAWTEWMNTDHPDPSRGSTGDYEWVLEARIEEILDGNCLIPCEDDKIMAMEVDIPAVDDDATFFDDCLNLDADAFKPSKGFYCMNTRQRSSTSKCKKNPECHAEMTDDCQCPDFRARYFCEGSAEDRNTYCQNVEAEFQSRDFSRQVRELTKKYQRELRQDDFQHLLIGLMKKELHLRGH